MIIHIIVLTIILVATFLIYKKGNMDKLKLKSLIAEYLKLGGDRDWVDINLRKYNVTLK